MVDLLQITPEARYEVTRRHLGDLAAVAAAADSVAVALAAQWASDICALQEFLWETVIVASPNLDEEFEKINGFVSTGFYEFTAQNPPTDAYEVLVAARAQVADVFADPAVLTGWQARCSDATHLSGRPTPSEVDWLTIRDEHIHAVAIPEVLRRRQTEIEDMANDILTNRPVLGDMTGHQRVWELDWTVFHAHLLNTAARCGDDFLVSVDLRWRVAHRKVAEIMELPLTAHEAAGLWRGVFARVVGPMEAAVLERHFLPV